MAKNSDDTQHIQTQGSPELDEALAWFEELESTQGTLDVRVPKPPLQASLPKFAPPTWLRQDMERVRLMRVDAPESPAPAVQAETLHDTSEDEHLRWLDDFATDLGAPIDEPPTHQWDQEPDGKPPPLSQAITRVALAGTVAASADIESEPDDDDEYGEFDTLIDDDPPLRHIDPPSSTRLLDDFPDDPDEVVGWLEKLAIAETGMAARKKLIVDQEPVSADDADVDADAAAMAWVEQIVGTQEPVVPPAKVVDAPPAEAAVVPPAKVAASPPLAEEADITADHPLAWLERLENEESGIVENLSAQKKRQIQPPPPPVATTGPYQAERQQAQAALDAGDSASAADQYRALLQQTDAIDPVIVDLLQATAAHPEASVLHRVLGDAYARKGDSARAAAAYRNAVRHK